MITGGAAMSGSITTSLITEARAAAMKSRTTMDPAAASGRDTAMAAGVIIANLIGADTAAGITASLTALMIMIVMNTATARASLITSDALKANLVSLTTEVVTAAPRREVSSSAPATRSNRGS